MNLYVSLRMGDSNSGLIDHLSSNARWVANREEPRAARLPGRDEDQKILFALSGQQTRGCDCLNSGGDRLPAGLFAKTEFSCSRWRCPFREEMLYLP